MKNRAKALVLTLAALSLSACERPEPTVDQASVERILSTLSADEMLGREAFTPGADMAAEFIAEEFASIGLDFFGDLTEYQQRFPVRQFIKVEDRPNIFAIKLVSKLH